MESVTVSVITPFYKGNDYMERLFACLRANAQSFRAQGTLELVLVNDSPGVPIVYAPEWVQGFSLTVVENEQNCGIHLSRINGLQKAAGEYVIFLDQDDLISDDAVACRYTARGDFDVIVSNGIEEAPPRPGRIYRTRAAQRSALFEDFYYSVGCRIVSPGHCLIKKSAIPQLWLQNIVTRNGADDMLLWIFMFREGKRFGVDEHVTYTHVCTGSNVSGDFEKMYASAVEVLEILQRTVGVSSLQEWRFRRRFAMRRRYEGKGALKKLLAYLCYPDIAFAMLRAKI